MTNIYSTFISLIIYFLLSKISPTTYNIIMLQQISQFTVHIFKQNVIKLPPKNYIISSRKYVSNMANGECDQNN